ncbi:MAG: allantoinase [Blastocatellia bacterium]|nr:allantoinase [Blastocatellia bacterium]
MQAMSLPDFIIRGRRVATPEGVRAAAVHILDGRIAAVAAFDEAVDGCPLVEADDDSIVMPGLVDTHVHVNEPGRTEWEGFETATRAAAAGGVTTIVEMPLNSIPPTTTVEHLRAKLEAARGKCAVDVGFWGGVVPGNVASLRPLFEAGVVGFKCFLVHSGVEEFPNVTEADLRAALPELKELGATLIVHAEVPAPIESATSAQAESSELDARRYATFLASRPRAAEDEAVELMIRLSRETGARMHIVHHSSADALPMLRQAKAEGLALTAETCPHYLAFAAEEIADGATEFKCCPPIRERENQERLWAALDEGLIEMIVSDHSPCPPEMKLKETGDFLQAWGGISSLQFRLPIVWTLASARGFSVERIVEWLCMAPARLVGLERRKGQIAAGFDADVVVWKPDETFKIEPENIYHRHKLTPYAGASLSGAVERTFLRGRLIYEGGRFPVEETTGELLLRGDFR